MCGRALVLGENSDLTFGGKSSREKGCQIAYNLYSKPVLCGRR